MRKLFEQFPSKSIMASMMIASLFGGFPQPVHAERNYNVQEVLQNGTVKGTIVDANGAPVIGATIRVKGTTMGVISDIDGNFTLDHTTTNATLQISFVGYQTQEIKLDGRNSVKVVLKEDSEMLDEVVVVGYGSMRKRT